MFVRSRQRTIILIIDRLINVFRRRRRRRQGQIHLSAIRRIREILRMIDPLMMRTRRIRIRHRIMKVVRSIGGTLLIGDRLWRARR